MLLWRHSWPYLDLVTNEYARMRYTAVISHHMSQFLYLETIKIHNINASLIKYDDICRKSVVIMKSFTVNKSTCFHSYSQRIEKKPRFLDDKYLRQRLVLLHCQTVQIPCVKNIIFINYGECEKYNLSLIACVHAQRSRVLEKKTPIFFACWSS